MLTISNASSSPTVRNKHQELHEKYVELPDLEMHAKKRARNIRALEPPPTPKGIRAPSACTLSVDGKH